MGILNQAKRLAVLIAFVGITLLFAGCGGDDSNEGYSEFDIHSDKSSTVNIPITIDLNGVKDRLNTSLPKTLASFKENKSDCVPPKYAKVCLVPKLFRSGCAVPMTKTKISPGIDCNISAHADRGEVSILSSDKGFTVKLPVFFEAVIRGRGDIGKHIRETVRGSVEFTAQVTPKISKDWNLSVDVAPNYSWRDRAYLRVLGIKITVGSHLEPEIEKALAQIQTEVNKAASAYDLRSEVEGLWKDMHKPLLINKEQNIWLSFMPESIGFSGFSGREGFVDLAVAASGKTSVVMGKLEDDQVVTELPELRDVSGGKGFFFSLPIIVDMDQITSQLDAVFPKSEEIEIDIDGIGEVGVTIDDISISSGKNDAVVAKLDLEVDPPNQLFDSDGTLVFSTKLEYDNEQQKLIPGEIEVVSDSDNPIYDLLMSIANLGLFKEKISEALTYDASTDAEKAIAQVNEALNQEVTEGVYLQGDIEELILNGLKTSQSAIYAELLVSGSLSLKVTN